jgi:hypothetical protein
VEGISVGSIYADIELNDEKLYRQLPLLGAELKKVKGEVESVAQELKQGGPEADRLADRLAELTAQQQHLEAACKVAAVQLGAFRQAAKAAAEGIGEITAAAPAAGAAIQRAAAATQTLNVGMAGIGRGAASGSYRLLQLGNTLDDLQYVGEQGLRPILNNIMQISPVAGIALIAIDQIYRHWDDLTGLFGDDSGFRRAFESIGSLKEHVAALHAEIEKRPRVGTVEALEGAEDELRKRRKDEESAKRMEKHETPEQKDAKERIEDVVSEFGGSLDEMARKLGRANFKREGAAASLDEADQATYASSRAKLAEAPNPADENDAVRRNQAEAAVASLEEKARAKAIANAKALIMRAPNDPNTAKLLAGLYRQIDANVADALEGKLKTVKEKKKEAEASKKGAGKDEARDAKDAAGHSKMVGAYADKLVEAEDAGATPDQARAAAEEEIRAKLVEVGEAPGRAKAIAPRLAKQAAGAVDQKVGKLLAADKAGSRAEAIEQLQREAEAKLEKEANDADLMRWDAEQAEMDAGHRRYIRARKAAIARAKAPARAIAKGKLGDRELAAPGSVSERDIEANLVAGGMEPDKAKARAADVHAQFKKYVDASVQERAGEDRAPGPAAPKAPAPGLPKNAQDRRLAEAKAHGEAARARRAQELQAARDGKAADLANARAKARGEVPGMASEPADAPGQPGDKARAAELADRREKARAKAQAAADRAQKHAEEIAPGFGKQAETGLVRGLLSGMDPDRVKADLARQAHDFLKGRGFSEEEATLAAGETVKDADHRVRERMAEAAMNPSAASQTIKGGGAALQERLQSAIGGGDTAKQQLKELQELVKLNQRQLDAAAKGRGFGLGSQPF